MNSGIYKLTITRPDGSELFYYGQSQDLRKRKSQHSSLLRRRSHGNPHLQKSWEKHGNVRFDVVLLCDMSDLNMFEQRFLDAYAGDPDCMNMSFCAEATMRGYKHSDETRAKMSASHTGKKKSPEHRARIGLAHLGMKRSETSRSNMSRACKGRKWSEEDLARRVSTQRAATPIFRWTHPDHGDVDAPLWEMIERWPELHKPNLINVQKGRQSHHKGWTKR